MNQIIIGFTTEGTTDIRFFESIIERTFFEIGMECSGQIEVLPLIYFRKEIGPFIDQSLELLRSAHEAGVMACCIHVDADYASDANVMISRILPLRSELESMPEDRVCKILVPVIPVQMTEAWMLADRDLLREEIGTTLSYAELGIEKRPETVADPKHVIRIAISKAMSSMAKRRRKELQIGDLYQPIGRKIGLDALRKLESYRQFEDAVRNAYRALNYLN